MGVSEPHPTHEMLMACRGAHRRQCAQLATCNSHQPLLSLVAALEQGQWQRRGRRGCSAHATWCETCASNGLRRAQEHPISGSILECALSMSGRPGRLVLRLWLAHACIHAGCTLKVGLLAAWASSSSRKVSWIPFPTVPGAGFGPSGPFESAHESRRRTCDYRLRGVVRGQVLPPPHARLGGFGLSRSARASEPARDTRAT